MKFARKSFHSIAMGEILLEQIALELACEGRSGSGEVLLLAEPQAEMV